ncbi:MAG: ribonucleoside-diphosphate reductase subunit alpha, partial [Propionibacteriaceae bacterium]
YTSAWAKGVKTTYYLHMMPRHTAEQSTVKVNKSEALRPTATPRTAPALVGHHASSGRRGFGFGARTAGPIEQVEQPGVQTTTPPPVEPEATLPLVDGDTEVADGAYCPIDPQERLQCESCQ